MVAINYSQLLVSAFALAFLSTASPLRPRDATPEDSITYCSTVQDTICSSTPDATSQEVVTIPAGWYGHFECYATVNGADRYFAGHPPAAPEANGLSEACWASASSLAAVPGGAGKQLCLKSQLANCCDMPNLLIEGLQCAKVAGLATDSYSS